MDESCVDCRGTGQVLAWNNQGTVPCGYCKGSGKYIPQATHHCPGCEAAARELADPRAHPIICGCGDHIGYAEVIGLSQDGAVCGNCATSRKDYDARTELATMRARLAAKATEWDEAEWPMIAYEEAMYQAAAEIRDLLAETEAK